MNKVFIGLILLLLSFYGGVLYTTYSNDWEGDHKDEISSLAFENKELLAVNLKLTTENEKLNNLTDSFKIAVLKSQSVRTKIEEERDETIDRIYDMDNTKLFRFFTEFETQTNQSSN